MTFIFPRFVADFNQLNGRTVVYSRQGNSTGWLNSLGSRPQEPYAGRSRRTFLVSGTGSGHRLASGLLADLLDRDRSRDPVLDRFRRLEIGEDCLQILVLRLSQVHPGHGRK